MIELAGGWRKITPAPGVLPLRHGRSLVTTGLMELLRCDSCGRPLSEGALRRGDAERRGVLLACRTCLAVEAGGQRLPVDENSPNARAWEQWYASQGAQTDTEPTRVIEPEFPRKPAGASHNGSASKPPVPVLPKPRSNRDRKITAKLPAARPREAASPVAAAAQVRSPFMLAAMILLAVVLPAFAVSLWIAISGQGEQQRLRGELELAKARTLDERGEFHRRINMLEGRLTEIERAARQQPASQPQHAQPPAPAPSNQPAPPPTAPPPEPTASRSVLPTEPLSDAEREQLDGHEQELAKQLTMGLVEATSPAARMLILGDVMTHRAIAAASSVRVFLKSAHSGERAMAAIVLGMLGDREALEQLRAIAGADEVREVRGAATEAINRISGRAPPDGLRSISDQSLQELEAQLAAAPNSRLLGDVRAELARRSRQGG